MKICSKCGVEKDLGEYRSRVGSKDGKHAQCRQCMSLVDRARRADASNPEKVLSKSLKKKEAASLAAIGKKLCSKCQTAKSLDEFQDRIDSKDGKRGACRECRKSACREWHYQNRDYALARHRKWLESNREHHRKKSREWRARNKEEALAREKRWREENAERHRANARRWWHNNRDRVKERRKIWRKRNKPRLIMYSLLHRTLGRDCDNKGVRTQEILGYGARQLREHIERQFTKGMSWENYGEWHIDHIVPIAEHFRNGVTDPAIVNCLTNLRPMWAKDNMRKSDNRTHLL